MFNSIPASFPIVCSLVFAAAAAGETIDKTGSTSPSIDPLASSYQARLGPLLEAPLQQRAPGRARAITAMLQSLTPLPDPGLPLKSAPLPLKDRGGIDWAKVYEKTAPAVVFLAGDSGFGTGFVIDAEQRWLVTNHHVARAAALDQDRHWGMNAYFGQLDDDGVMQPSDQPVRAVVYGWDAQRDLALLKLASGSPIGGELELVRKGRPGLPKAGQDVALIGNGAVGLLWAMKPGYIASLGTLSRNIPFLISRINEMHGLDPSVATRPGVLERLQEEVGRGFEGWIGGNTLLIQATAQATQGDSGGPLVDEKGTVVGIAMGLRVDQDTASSASYYIHVDEIHDFVAQAPNQPLLEVASSFWETTAVAFGLADATGDGVIDLLQGYDAANNVVMSAMDLDQDTELESLFAEIPIRSPVVGVFPTAQGSITVYENGILVGAAANDVTWRQRHAGQVASVALAPDGSTGALGYADGTVGVYEAASGALSWRKALDGTPVTAVAFSPASLWLGTAGGAVVEVTLGGELIRQIPLQKGVMAMAAAPNGQYVAVGEMRGPLRLYDATNGRELWSNPDLPVYALRFSPDSHHLVASPQGNAKQLYWMKTWSGDGIREIHLPSSPYSFELSEDGSSVAALLHDQGRYVVTSAEESQLVADWHITEPTGQALLDRLLAGEPASNRPVARFAFRDGTLLTGDVTGMLFEVDLMAGEEARGFHHQILAPDLSVVVASKAFDAEFAWLLDARANSCYVMYDLDNDTRFDVIRVDDAADLVLDSEYRREGGDLVRGEADAGEEVFLHPSQLPPPWQPNYLVSLGGS